MYGKGIQNLDYELIQFVQLSFVFECWKLVLIYKYIKHAKFDNRIQKI